MVESSRGCGTMPVRPRRAAQSGSGADVYVERSATTPLETLRQWVGSRVHRAEPRIRHRRGRGGRAATRRGSVGRQLAAAKRRRSDAPRPAGRWGLRSDPGRRGPARPALRRVWSATEMTTPSPWRRRQRGGPGPEGARGLDARRSGSGSAGSKRARMAPGGRARRGSGSPPTPCRRISLTCRWILRTGRP